MSIYRGLAWIQPETQQGSQDSPVAD